MAGVEPPPPGTIQHAIFERNVEVPVATLIRIKAVGELPAALEAASVGPSRGQSMVSPVCRVEDGNITEVVNVIVSDNRRSRFCAPANLIHAEAPPEFRMTLSKDFSKFAFRPGNNQSGWIEASALGVKFYSKYGQHQDERVLATQEEVNRYSLNNFQVRLCLSPTEDPTFVAPSFVAIPVRTEDMNRLINPDIAKEGMGYPVCLIGKEQKIQVGPKLGPDEEFFGAPCRPPLLFLLPGPDPSAAEVLTSVLAAWGQATAPRLVEAELWEQATAMDPVVASTIPAPMRWPMITPAPRQRDEGALMLRC